jgi:hypothetical protein
MIFFFLKAETWIVWSANRVFSLRNEVSIISSLLTFSFGLQNEMSWSITTLFLTTWCTNSSRMRWFLTINQLFTIMLTDEKVAHDRGYVLPPFQNVCRFRFSCHTFDSICRKYVQHLYPQINLLKKLDLKIFPMILIMYYKY